jgi:signal transduction histidine kinase
MRYRAAIIDAELKIESAPGAGTRVCCKLAPIVPA